MSEARGPEREIWKSAQVWSFATVSRRPLSLPDAAGWKRTTPIGGYLDRFLHGLGRPANELWDYSSLPTAHRLATTPRVWG